MQHRQDGDGGPDDARAPVHPEELWQGRRAVRHQSRRLAARKWCGWTHVLRWSGGWWIRGMKWK